MRGGHYLEFRYTVTYKEYKSAQGAVAALISRSGRHATYVPPYVVWIVLTSVISIAIAFFAYLGELPEIPTWNETVAGIGDFFQKAPTAPSYSIFTAIFVFCGASVMITHFQRLRRGYRVWTSEVMIACLPDVVDFASPGLYQRFRWELFWQWAETPTVLVLVLRDGQFIPIPRRVLGVSESALRLTFNQHIGVKALNTNAFPIEVDPPPVVAFDAEVMAATQKNAGIVEYEDTSGCA